MLISRSLRFAARLSTHARTPAQQHQFALYEALAARDASDEMLQTANSALTCHPRGPRRELPMPNRRKSDVYEPAFRRLIDDVAAADECARARALVGRCDVVDQTAECGLVDVGFSPVWHRQLAAWTAWMACQRRICGL